MPWNQICPTFNKNIFAQYPNPSFQIQIREQKKLGERKNGHGNEDRECTLETLKWQKFSLKCSWTYWHFWLKLSLTAFSLMQEMKEVAFLEKEIGNFSKHDFLFLFESWLSIYSLYSSLLSGDHMPYSDLLNVSMFQMQGFSWWSLLLFSPMFWVK